MQNIFCSVVRRAWAGEMMCDQTGFGMAGTNEFPCDSECCSSCVL